MKRFRELVGGSLILIGVASILGGLVFGQQVVSPSSSSPVTQGSPSLLQTVIQEQQTLGQEEAVLLNEGATAATLDTWQTQNASGFQTLQENAASLGAQGITQPLPYVTGVPISDGDSALMGDFLVAQGNLANAFAQIHNQMIVSAVGATAIAQIPQNEATSFQQQNSSAMLAVQQQAQALAAVAAPLPLPPPLVIPSDATPQLVSFLTLRNQLAQGQAQVWNQNLSTDAATRNAAVTQWQQQNAANFIQLNQLSQNLPPETAY